MPRYRKKPVEIEAVQWTGEDPYGLMGWVNDSWLQGAPIASVENDTLVLRTLEGDMRASVGDWIIQGVQGEFYPCKPEIFEATYEPVGEDAGLQGASP